MKMFVTRLLFVALGAVTFPPTKLLVWLFVVMVLDLITGIAKAITKGEKRTSKGYRQTISKFIQYGGAISVSVILSNLKEFEDSKTSEVYTRVIEYFTSGLVMFIIMIEIKSVLENLEDISPDSDFTRYFIRPINKILEFEFLNKVPKT